MPNIDILAKFKLRPGRFDEFRDFSEKCIQHIRDVGKGITRYDWYFSEDETECVVLECYESIEAFIQHMEDTAELMPVGLELGELSAVILGDPGEEMTAALAEFDIKYYDRHLVLH